jgi:hypothetical protein
MADMMTAAVRYTPNAHHSQSARICNHRLAFEVVDNNRIPRFSCDGTPVCVSAGLFEAGGLNGLCEARSRGDGFRRGLDRL